MKEGRPPTALESAERASPSIGDDKRNEPRAAASMERQGYLLDHIAQNYGSLLGRLGARLRSKDAAADALHDLYLKLKNGTSFDGVKSPAAYLYRAALNIAHNNRRKDRRRSNAGLASLDCWTDEAPGPDRIVTGRHDLDLGLAALDRLSLRQRQIFLASWRDEKSQDEIATLFGLHKRTIQKELAHVEAHIRRILRGG